MKSNHILNLLICLIIILIPFHSSYSQFIQFYQKFTPGTTVGTIEYTTDPEDPNIVYWNDNVKQFGLDVLYFNTTILPTELVFNANEINDQYDNCLNQWNQNGCIVIKPNYLIGCPIEFSNDQNIFKNSSLMGATCYAITEYDGRYQFEFYPAISLSYGMTTLLLNNRDDFDYTWTIEEDNIGLEYVPFKTILLHEMGHLVGVGHNIDGEAQTLMQPAYLMNNFIFNLTDNDILGLQETCDINGTPTGIEDDIFIYSYPTTITPNIYNSGFAANFIDQFPYGDYLIDGINWKLEALHAQGEVEISGGPSYFSNLPSGYCWQRDASGNVKGIVTAYGTDNDGHHHESSVIVGITNVALNTTVGILGSDETWCGSMTITGDLTIPSGITLNILPGANLVFENNASLIVNGELISNGISYFQPEFDFVAQNSSYQNGIKVNPGGYINISYSIIKNAYRGIYINESEALIDHCEFYNCYSGMHLYRTNYTSDDPYITNNFSHDNQFGLVAYYSSPYLTDNEFSNNLRGIGCADFSSPYLGYAGAYGHNYIHDNSIGIYTYGYSNPFLGRSTCTIQGGENRIENNLYQNIYANTYSSIIAENNWWGSSPPVSSKFYISSNSSIDYDPWLTYVPQFMLIENNEQSPEELLYDMEIENSARINEISMDVNKDVELISEESTELDSEVINSFSSEWPIYWKLLYARNLIDVKKYKFAQEICKDIILNNPDSTLSYYAFDLLWRASRKYDKDSLINFLTKISSMKTKKTLFILAELVLAGYKDESRLNNLEQMEANYKTDPILEFILFQKFLNLYYEECDFIGASSVAQQLEKSFPESESTLDALRHLKEIDIQNTQESMTKEDKTIENETIRPSEYKLLGNFPNPFNPTTTISYALPFNSKVEIIIYDLMGREVQTYIYNFLASGYQNTVWDGKNLNGIQVASGIYIYRIKAKSLENDTQMFVASAKLILMK